jgi:hypothetical protein
MTSWWSFEIWQVKSVAGTTEAGSLPHANGYLLADHHRVGRVLRATDKISAVSDLR